MEEKEIVSYCMGCGKVKHKHEGAKWVKDDRDIYNYSHGYCPPCCKKVMAEYMKELKALERQERQA
jgi:hypothetical protein